MSDEGTGGSYEGLPIEKIEFGDQATSENVTEQLRNIRQRGNPVTRFQGYEIIQADLDDLNLRKRAGEDENKINKEKADVNRIKGLLASIDSTLASKSEIEASRDIIGYFEAKRKDWEKIPEADSDYAEAQENINVYNALIADIRKHLPKNDTEKAGESKEVTETNYDQPTLVELVAEAPRFVYQPKDAAKELSGLKVKELTDISDVETYFKAQREDIESWEKSAKEANPEWEKYQPAAVAFIHYFDKPENKGVPTNQPFVVTIQSNDEIDIRPLSEPQLEAGNDSQQIIIDYERDAPILERYFIFDLYDKMTKDAVTGLEKLKQSPPLSITHAEHDALTRLPTFHRNYIAEHQIESADGPKLQAIDQLVNSAISAGSVKN